MVGWRATCSGVWEQACAEVNSSSPGTGRSLRITLIDGQGQFLSPLLAEVGPQHLLRILVSRGAECND